MAAAPLVWINGFPGVGKYTIAKQLITLLGNENAILIDNHQLIDPVEAEMTQKHPEYRNIRLHPDYQLRRRQKHVKTFEQYVLDRSMLSTTVVFTDFQSHNGLGHNIAMEYINAALQSGRAFLPINVKCEMEENMSRVQSVERQQSGSGKLLDSKELKAMWTRSKLLSFGDRESFDIDVTHCSPQQAAIVVRDLVMANV